MSIDRYLNKRYDRQKYNCAHLACEVWKDATGQDLSQFLSGFLSGRESRVARRADLNQFHRLTNPVSPCLVLMNPVGNREPHVGVFLRGKIIHITHLGVLWQRPELATLGYKTVRYYSC